jgi:hypothetical protein
MAVRAEAKAVALPIDDRCSVLIELSRRTIKDLLQYRVSIDGTVHREAEVVQRHLDLDRPRAASLAPTARDSDTVVDL